MSIAWAIVEYIHQHREKAKTLFATHYHELSTMEDKLPNVKNYNIAAKKHGDDIIFLRKTDDDVTEVIRQVKMLLRHDAMRCLSQMIYGRPVEVLRSDMFSVHTDCFRAMRGCQQLLGIGTYGSLTGKHADIVITDDIVNLQDRIRFSLWNHSHTTQAKVIIG